MSEGPSQFLDPKYVRFLQMKLLGEPLEKIKEQAAAAGLDPSYLDQDFPDYRLDPDYKYYLDEMQHGTAMDVLKEKMLEHGLDPTVLDVYDIGRRETVRVDYSKYIKWFRMKEQGGDLALIRLEMEQEGLDSSYLDRDAKNIEFYNIPYDLVVNSFRTVKGPEKEPEKEPVREPVREPVKEPVKEEPVPEAPAEGVCKHNYVRHVDYAYYRMFKLLRLHRPKEQVKMTMERNNLDPSILDLDMNTLAFDNIPDDEFVRYDDGHYEPCWKPDPDAELTTKEPVPEAPAEGVCKHNYARHVDYAYYRMFKLLRLHRPKEQVKMTMERNNLDPSILDLDMNTLAFDNIPDDEFVRYDDGHYEPCWKQDPDAPAEGVCKHNYARHVDYAYYRMFKLLRLHRPKEQVKMTMERNNLDPSILDLDMNTLAFDNIPDDEFVRYDDGHYEPCWKPDPDAEQTTKEPDESSKEPEPAPTPNPAPVNTDEREKRPYLSVDLNLRPVYWEANNSNALIRGSMWEKMDDSEIKIDRDMMQREFQAKASAVTFVMPTSQSENVTTLLDGQRERNVGIVIGRIRLDVQDICHALLFVDFNVLTKDLVMKLVSAVPTPEEQEVFRNYNGDVRSLSKASQFGYHLRDIPNLQQRVNCYKIILSFDEELERLKSALQVYFDVIRMVRNNKGLYTVLEIILALGNFLNGNRARGGAWGFHIEFLTKLKNTKTSDNEKTLLT